MTVGDVFDKALPWLYPPRCILCECLMDVKSTEAFCSICMETITYIDENICEKCGAPAKTHELDENFFCNVCRNSIFSFERNVSLFEYDKRFREIIHNIKYKKNPYYAKKLGEFCSFLIERDEMGIRQQFSAFDMLIPVPIHKNRQRERGFNQSEVLGDYVAKSLGVPLVKDAVIRTKDTQMQSLLSSRRERALNVKDAFLADSNKLMGKTVIVFDDIFTTGSTMESISRLLLNNGAAKVISLTVCGTFKTVNNSYIGTM
ncbi:MAG: ComF family protein [Clostridiales bacterium]|jgi:ComF family protein|nr:ComF family protein [Clostridiales bacterium]